MRNLRAPLQLCRTPGALRAQRRAEEEETERVLSVTEGKAAQGESAASYHRSSSRNPGNEVTSPEQPVCFWTVAQFELNHTHTHTPRDKNTKNVLEMMGFQINGSQHPTPPSGEPRENQRTLVRDQNQTLSNTLGACLLSRGSGVRVCPGSRVQQFTGRPATYLQASNHTLPFSRRTAAALTGQNRPGPHGGPPGATGAGSGSRPPAQQSESSDGGRISQPLPGQRGPDQALRSRKDHKNTC